MNWETLTVTSLEDYNKQLSAILPDEWRGMYYFRGQSDESWELRPSLERFLDELKGDRIMTEHDAQEYERYAVAKFRQEFHKINRRKKIPLERDWLGWMALMQHCGAPTRLLDWTKEPSVAAFFACKDHFCKKGAVYIVNSRDLPLCKEPSAEEVEQFLYERSQGHPRFFFFDKNDFVGRRARRQASVLCASSHVYSGRDDLISQSAYRIWSGTKLVLTAEVKADLLSHLLNRNLNERYFLDRNNRDSVAVCVRHEMATDILHGLRFLMPVGPEAH